MATEDSSETNLVPIGATRKPAGKEHLPNVELVRLNIPFELFPKGKLKRSVFMDLESWVRRIGLVSNEGDVPLPMKVGLEEIDTWSISPSAPHNEVFNPPKRRLYITPIDPSLGYEIDADDLDPAKRAEKLKKLDQEVIDANKAKYSISIDLETEYLHSLGLTHKRKSTFLPEFDPPGFYVHDFKPGVAAAIEQLRFQILFPSGILESRPSHLGLATTKLNFSTFYRADFPPPVAVEQATSATVADWVWPKIAVPNLKSMQGVMAKFFFAHGEIGAGLRNPAA